VNEPLTRTMSSQLTTRLRDRILAGTYAPGSQLLQDALAAEFGVSKIPVREALVQLRGEGLVDIFAHRGFQVRPLSAVELEEVFRLRLQIEPPAVAEGARRANSSDRDATRTAFERLNLALTTKELGKSGALNRAFHLALIVPKLQPVSSEILGRLHVLAQRYVQVHLMPRGRVNRATREHAALLEAWETGKAKEAARLTRLHIEGARDDLAQYLDADK
jgi:DNA-binding GntR family transcriptional regulator